MAELKLQPAESALWHEAGSRGDAFRRAMVDRAAEEVRVKREPVEIIDARGQTVETITKP